MKKEKYDIEFVLGNASHKSLWRMLTDPTALEEWFADKVTLDDGTFYTFVWDKKAMKTEMVLNRPKYVLIGYLKTHQIVILSLNYIN